MAKRYKNSFSNPITIISSLIVLCVIFLSVGYTAFQSIFEIGGLAAIARIQKDIRITNIVSSTSTSSAYSNYEEYNVKNIYASITLPNSDSTMAYDITITNIGNVEMGILDITGLPSNLTYSISNYTLKSPLCDDVDSTQCKLGAVSKLHIVIGYAQNGYDSSKITYNVDMSFDFRQIYEISYIGFSDITTLPPIIMDGETKSIIFNNTTGIPASVSISNATGSYSNNTLVLSNATDNVVITRKYSVTYIDFTGDTSGLTSLVGPEGGTISFNSTTGLPEYVVVTGAIANYNSNTYVLTLTNVISNVTITMADNGKVEITSVTRTDILNITENNSPQITNDGQGVTFDLGVTVDQSNYDQDFYVTYAIVVNNDSVYEQKVLATNFRPNIIGTGNVPDVTYTITDENGNQVLNTTISAKTSETYYLTINIDPHEEGTWGVEGESSVDTAENGTITASISGSNQGDLTGNNTTAHFTASVTNTYDMHQGTSRIRE